MITSASADDHTSMSLTPKVIVTGGAGFIGSNLAEELIRRGAKVTIIDNLITGFEENLNEIRGEFEFVKGDVNDTELVNAVIAGTDTVFHQAALPSVPRSVEDPAETHRACVDGTFNLLLAARNNNIRRFVYAASSSAYGDQATLPKAETMRPDPMSPYAVAKLAGEYYCRAFHSVYGLETISLRYFNVFGPRQNPSSMYSGVISRFIDALAKGERPVIFGDGGQSRDFTYVANVVDANIRAAETQAGLGEVMNVANGERTTLLELLDVLGRVIGVDAVSPEFREPRRGDVRHSQADNRRAVECLGYSKLVGLEEGLKLTYDWWRSSRFSKT